MTNGKLNELKEAIMELDAGSPEETLRWLEELASTIELQEMAIREEQDDD